MKNLGRILAVMIGIAFGVATAGTTANAGDYTVDACLPTTNPGTWVTYVESPANNAGFVGWPNCPGGSLIRAVGPTNPGDSASMRIEALQGTGFLGVKFWYQNPSQNGVSSRFIFNNAGGVNAQVLNVPLHTNLYASDTWFDVTDGQPRSVFRATLQCENAVNPCGSGSAIGFDQNTWFKMRDSMAPSSADFLGGTLFDPGTVSGTRTAFVGGIDNGSGISWITMNVNDVWTFASAFDCSNPGLRPCPRTPTTTFNVDTGGANFVNGLNKITLCVQDYATSGARNVKCENRYINVAK